MKNNALTAFAALVSSRGVRLCIALCRYALLALALLAGACALSAQSPLLLAPPVQAKAEPSSADILPEQAIKSVEKLAEFKSQVLAQLTIAPSLQESAALEAAFAALAQRVSAPDEDFSLAKLPSLPVEFAALKPLIKANHSLLLALGLREEIAQAAPSFSDGEKPRTVDALFKLLRKLDLAANLKAIARERDALAQSAEQLKNYLEQAATNLQLGASARVALQKIALQTHELPNLDNFSGLLSFQQIRAYGQQQIQALAAQAARAQLRLADQALDIEKAALEVKRAQRRLQASDAAFIRAFRSSELSAGRLGDAAQKELETARDAAKSALQILEDSVLELQWLEAAERKQWLEKTPWLRRQFSNIGSLWTGLSSVLGRTLDYGFFTVGETPITLGGIGRVLLILLFAWFISKWLRRGLTRYSERVASSSRPALYSLGRVLHYVILALGASIALSAIGLDLSNIAIFATALGVGIGFGLQTIVSNFISGLILLFERSLKLGDFVELASGVHGSVSDISIRATRITTNDNIDILVPNSEFINGQVTNWTLREARCRIKIPFSVAYGTDKELVKRAALEAAASVPFTLAAEGPHRAQVWLVTFGDSSLGFNLVIWLTPDAVYRPGAVHAAYCWALDDALRKYNIEIPFPQIDVHLRSFFGATLEQAQRRFHEPPEHSDVPAPVAKMPTAPATNDALEDALEATQQRQDEKDAAELADSAAPDPEPNSGSGA